MNTTGASKTVRILRLESARTGAGPYGTLRFPNRPAFLNTWGDPKRPAPHHDNIPSYSGRYFGFTSARQLREWFTPVEQRELFVRGLELLYYEVPAEDVVLGRRQCAFKRTNRAVVKWRTRQPVRTEKHVKIVGALCQTAV